MKTTITDSAEEQAKRDNKLAEFVTARLAEDMFQNARHWAAMTVREWSREAQLKFLDLDNQHEADVAIVIEQLGFDPRRKTRMTMARL